MVVSPTWLMVRRHDGWTRRRDGPSLGDNRAAVAPWRDLPDRYGPWRTEYARFVRWQRDGTWDRLLADVQTTSDVVGDVIWEVSVDSSVVRAHQHAAGAPKRGATRHRPRRSDAAEAG